MSQVVTIWLFPFDLIPQVMISAVKEDCVATAHAVAVWGIQVLHEDQ